jgi:Na+(H+)/acetate symporter ActP
MFNAVLKIPMQVFILSLGVLLFVFYQFESPPVFFNQVAWSNRAAAGDRAAFDELESRFATAHNEQRERLDAWIEARHRNDRSAEEASRAAALATQQRLAEIRKEAAQAASPDPKKVVTDADYVFITFVLGYLPHGLIGLLIAVFFSAALSSKAAELNALASTTTVDIYRHIIRSDGEDAHYLTASKFFTVMWGFISILFALFLGQAENLIQAVNIIGSIFYPIMLGLFLVGVFLKRVGGTAAFFGALIAQLMVISLYLGTNISYLWYNPIGCLGCMLFSALLQACLAPAPPIEPPAEPSGPGP